MRHAHLLGAREPADVAARARAGARDGRGLSGAASRRGADHRDPAPGGDALPPHAGARHAPFSRRRPGRSAHGGVLSGETAFSLYDTYGFPLDLTQDAVRARGLTVDLEGFDAAMERQRAGRAAPGRARARRRPRRSGTPCASGSGRPLPRLRPPRGGGRDRSRSSRTAIEVRAARGRRQGSRSCSTRRPSTARAAARPATWARALGRGSGRGDSTPTRSSATSRPRRSRSSRATARPRMAVELAVVTPRRTRTRANHSAAHLLHAALRHRAGPARGPEGPAGRRRPAPLRLRPSEADHPGGDRRGGGHGQRV